jgi:hypothetical protein
VVTKIQREKAIGQRERTCGVLVAHTCNPSYLGGRVQEDRGSKPTWANSLQDPILKMPNTKAGRVAQGVGPDSSSSTTKKERKKESTNFGPGCSQLK